MRLGQRGIAFIGPLSHLIAYAVIAAHPPYPVLIVIFALAGFGNGILDGAWNAWIGSMASANELLGFLHGLYGLGAVISPLAATTMIVNNGFPWYSFYYLMVRLSLPPILFFVPPLCELPPISLSPLNPHQLIVCSRLGAPQSNSSPPSSPSGPLPAPPSVPPTPAPRRTRATG